MEAPISVTWADIFPHPFFDYIGDDKDEVEERIARGVSRVLIFKVDGVETCGAIIDYHYDDLHVRWLGGKFPKLAKHILRFCEGMASAFGFKRVTFRSAVKAVVYQAKKLGFADGEEETLFIKNIKFRDIIA